MYGNFFNNSGFLLITSICAESITAKEQYRHNGVKLFLEEVYNLKIFLKMERIISKVHKGPFKYYVSKKVGGWGMTNTYVCLHGGWV